MGWLRTEFWIQRISESDMVGLTGFTAATYGSPNFPKEVIDMAVVFQTAH